MDLYLPWSSQDFPSPITGIIFVFIALKNLQKMPQIHSQRAYNNFSGTCTQMLVSFHVWKKSPTKKIFFYETLPNKHFSSILYTCFLPSFSFDMIIISFSSDEVMRFFAKFSCQSLSMSFSCARLMYSVCCMTTICPRYSMELLLSIVDH